MKVIIGLLTFLFFCEGGNQLFAEPVTVEQTEPSLTSPSAAPMVLEPSAWEDAKKAEQEGKLREAQTLYEKSLQSQTLTEDQRKEIQKAYDNINLKILFSPAEMSESTFYVVAAGDSLHKIAKKFGTTIELIKRSNALSSDTIYPGMKLKVITGKFLVRVSKADNVLVLLLNEKPVKHYSVATGTDNKTPIGQFKITTKLVEPTWYKTGAIVPPGSKDNILGTRWMGFDRPPGYGIHGTTLPESIGTQSTSGCVRMLNPEVEELYTILPVGAEVTIVD